MSRKKGSRELSAHETELWNKIVKHATPLSRTIASKLTINDRTPAKPARPEPRSVAEIPEGFSLGAAVEKPARVFRFTEPVDASSVSISMDKKDFGRMKRGKLRPEARLDLHGMTLADAHPALHRFVLNALSDGLRLVLVITGKGKEKEDLGPIPVRIGALRHQVPIWLRSPSLSHAVLEVAPAHQRHGGTGAYYVYLRRRR